METITFEISHFVTFKLEMVHYPELSSDKKWIQKGIDLLKKHAARIHHYLSKQRVLAKLKDYKIIVEVRPRRRGSRREHKKNEPKAVNRRQKWTKRMFKIWVQKEKAKRLIFIILESLIIPLTPIAALLPGPNFFFYVPALLLYYHFTSYQGLRKVRVKQLEFEVRYVAP